jgi:hypothetical protein
MRNLFKKLTAFALLLCFVTGVTPVSAVKEVMAAPGENLIIVTNDSIMDGYDLTFTFPAYVTEEGETFVEYRVYARNLTANAPYPVEPDIVLPVNHDDNTGTITVDDSLILDQGSMYSFSVRPAVRVITGYDDMDVPVYGVEERGQISAFAALTNIEVTAVGEEDTMTVTWDYPTAPGTADFFTAYNIYYANIDGNTVQPLQWSTNVVRAEAGSIQKADGKVSYSIKNPDFQVGNIYAIRVEPVYNGSERGSLATELLIGGQTYNFRSDLSRHYITDNAYIRPQVTLDTNSLTNITINWQSLANKPLSGNIRQLVVYEVTGEGEDEQKRIIQTFRMPSAATTTSATTTRPQGGSARYYIEAEYADISYMDASGLPVERYNVTVVSTEGVYDPGALEFAPYRPDIYEITDNRAKPFTLDIVWKAFYRDPLNQAEIDASSIVNGVPKYLDQNVVYEIAITDDPENFQYMGRDESTVIEGNTVAPEFIDSYPYLSENIDTYYTQGEVGGLEELPFAQNKIYYVRIKAIRADTGEESKYAFGAHYIMPVDSIPVEPSMIAVPPLRIKEVDGIEVVDHQSITVEWDEKWTEIYNPDDGHWYSKAALVDGVILYGDQVPSGHDNAIDMSKTEQDILTALGLYPVTDANVSRSVLRNLDITGANYKMHVVEYDILTQYGYDEYFNEIIEPDTTYEWEDIDPTATGDITMEYLVDTSHNEAITPLKPGTPYVVFIRPFITADEIDKLAYYPSYVTATTLTERPDMEIDPTVPILEVVNTTDTTVTVRWKYTTALSYELRIDERFSNYPDSGREITTEDILEKGILENDPETGQLYMDYTIDLLYPNTLYYIWIRSTADNESGLVQSDWSNAVEARTLDIAPPDPPRGLGLASRGSLSVYNLENDTTWEPSTLEYLIIEWMRINADKNNVTGDGTIPPGGGAPPAEGEGETGGDLTGTAEYLENPGVPDMYMVKFAELIANRHYNIRAKTRLLITKEADGSGTRSYSYIVQLSLDPNFTDVIEIEVPQAADTTAGVYKDSDWVSVILITEKSTGEYDGDKNPDLYPLPDQDFEVIYDDNTSTLTYRFRGMGKDADGNNDNQVDERFISRLISNRTFDYTVDLSAYEDKIPKNRVVEFPYSIIKAFNERKINLTVKADNYTVTLPYESLLTGEVKTMGDLSKTASLRVNIIQNPPEYITQEPVNYVSAPQKLTATLTTSAGTYNYQYFAKPLNMNLLVSGQYIEGATNIGAYVQDGNSAGWQRLDGAFDTITKSVNFTSQRVGAYSLIGLVTPWAEDGTTLPNMYSVNSKLNITDIGTYAETQSIMKGQLNQLMAAVLKGSPSVVMNVNLTPEDLDALQKTGLLFTCNGNDFFKSE